MAGEVPQGVSQRTGCSPAQALRRAQRPLDAELRAEFLAARFLGPPVAPGQPTLESGQTAILSHADKAGQFDHSSVAPPKALQAQSRPTNHIAAFVIFGA